MATRSNLWASRRSSNSVPTATQYYTTAETFNGAYQIWIQATQDLYGAADAAEVRKALEAVEMDHPGPCTGQPAPTAPKSSTARLLQQLRLRRQRPCGATVADDKAIAPEKMRCCRVREPVCATTRIQSRHQRRHGRRGTSQGSCGDHCRRLRVSRRQFGRLLSWQPGPAPTNVWVRAKEGRIAITWADAAITKKWLEVRLKANDRTGLLQDDVFYFGNAVGESGDSANNTLVNDADVSGARNNPHDPSNPALINDAFDYNRDSLVNDADEAVARENATDPATSLVLLNLGGGRATVTVNSLTTNDRTPVISGTVSGGTLHVSVNGRRTQRDGQISQSMARTGRCTCPRQIAAGRQVRRRGHSDRPGRKRQCDATASELVVDTAKPVVTVTSLVSKNSKPTLTGTVADAAPTSGLVGVSVVVGGQTLTATLTGSAWSVTLPAALADGTYNVAAIATDLAGNAGSDATASELVVDTTPPGTPVVTGISDDTGVSQSDRVTSDPTLAIHGTAEASSLVEVFSMRPALAWQSSVVRVSGHSITRARRRPRPLRSHSQSHGRGGEHECRIRASPHRGCFLD